MMLTLRLFILLMLSFPAMADAREALVSHLPESGAPEFLFNNLDIATFRSSLGPRRSQSDRTFASLSPPPTTVTADYVEIREDNWVRRLTIVDRGDFNKDGIEDLVVCFDDRAIGATYRSTQLLYVTRYSDASMAIALSYSASTPKARESCRVTPEG